MTYWPFTYIHYMATIPILIYVKYHKNCCQTDLLTYTIANYCIKLSDDSTADFFKAL